MFAFHLVWACEFKLEKHHNRKASGGKITHSHTQSTFWVWWDRNVILVSLKIRWWILWEATSNVCWIVMKNFLNLIAEQVRIPPQASDVTFLLLLQFIMIIPRFLWCLYSLLHLACNAQICLGGRYEWYLEWNFQEDSRFSVVFTVTDALRMGASAFEQQAARLKRKFWWQNLKASCSYIIVC